MPDERCFTNTFVQDDEELLKTILDDQNELVDPISSKIRTFIVEQVERLNKVIETKEISSRDSSSYTGLAGIAMLFWKLSNDRRLADDTKRKYLNTCKKLLSKADKQVYQDRITFLCGDSGILVLSALSDEKNRESYIKYLKSMSNYLSDKKLPNEVLYGRAGYLFSLLFVKKYLSTAADSEIDDLIKKVCQMILEEGRSDASRNRSFTPLFYQWHKKEYIGAAHGYIGILYMLLQANCLLPQALQEEDHNLIKTCLDELLKKRFTSGNIRSSIESDTDKLIHWCHGAPGAVHLYALAHKVYKEEIYIQAAKTFADVIWERGILKKGYGLCHGVSGNAYGFLCMYQLTMDKKYLWRATKFAEWCLDYGIHGCREADRPYSLYEGLAGTVYFLHDILSPTVASFPGFQLISYEC